jgi:hypothetical protein
MSNAASTYLGIVAGAAIGAVISWWIYNRQKKTSDMQDNILSRIQELDQNHDILLQRIKNFEEQNNKTLKAILELSNKMDSVIEGRDIERS